MKYDFKKQLRSFGYAWKGIRCCIGKEQNLSFHLIATVVTVIAGFLLEITRIDWMIVILCIGVVIAAELFNSAIEKLVEPGFSGTTSHCRASKRHSRRSSIGMCCNGGHYRD